MQVFSLEQKNETDSTFMGVFDSLDAAQAAAQADNSAEFDPEWDSDYRNEILEWEKPSSRKGYVVHDTTGDYPAYVIVESELNSPCWYYQDR